MGKFGIALIAAAAMGLTPAITSAAVAARRKASPTCPAAHQRLIVADTQAVVYQGLAETQAEGEIFACSYTNGRSVRLGPPPYGSATGSGGVVPIELSGPAVAYGFGKSGGPPMGHSFEEIWVRNLATGKIIPRVPTGSPAEPGDVGLGETNAIVVKSDGSVGWIVRASGELGSIQVRSLDKAGSHLLAASPEIEPNSLALAGSALYWTQDGKLLSARLQ